MSIATVPSCIVAESAPIARAQLRNEAQRIRRGTSGLLHLQTFAVREPLEVYLDPFSAPHTTGTKALRLSPSAPSKSGKAHLRLQVEQAQQGVWLYELFGGLLGDAAHSLDEAARTALLDHLEKSPWGALALWTSHTAPCTPARLARRMRTVLTHEASFGDASYSTTRNRKMPFEALLERELDAPRLFWGIAPDVNTRAAAWMVIEKLERTTDAQWMERMVALASVFAASNRRLAPDLALLADDALIQTMQAHAHDPELLGCCAHSMFSLAYNTLRRVRSAKDDRAA